MDATRRLTCKERFGEVRRYREAFFAGADQRELNGLNIYMDPDVLAAWFTLRETHFAPKLAGSFGIPLPPNEYEKVLKDHSALVRIIQPIFDKYLYLDSSKFCGLGLITTDNIMLIQTECAFFSFKPGYHVGMETVGNTGHSMSHALRRPIQLLSPEHYDERIADLDFIVSSIPILDANGDIVASLGYYHYLDEALFGCDLAQYLRSGFGLVRALATSVENQLRQAANKDLDGDDPRFSGKILADPSGRIAEIDATAASLLGIRRDDPAPKSLERLFPHHPYLVEIVRKRGSLDIVDTFERCGRVRLRINETGSPPGRSSANMEICLQSDRKTPAPENKAAAKDTDFSFDDIIGPSSSLKDTIQICKQFAKNSENILLTGESGTGKEMFAQSIHRASRPSAPFVAVNCAAFPRELIESELLGYESGSFTGADRKGKPGKIELANGGTLFMDEIGDMPLDLQAVLLRVLQDKKVTRIGGYKSINIDFRVIAATNQNLEEMVEERRFREDLFYRLCVLPVNIPPLRERVRDIRALCGYFLNEYCTKFYLPEPTIDESVYGYFEEYNWPGNVRQLRNAIVYSENMARHHHSPTIAARHLPNYLLHSPKKTIAPAAARNPNREDTSTINLEELERQAIKKAQILADNNVTRMAALLGISPSTLYRKMKEYDP